MDFSKEIISFLNYNVHVSVNMALSKQIKVPLSSQRFSIFSRESINNQLHIIRKHSSMGI